MLGKSGSACVALLKSKTGGRRWSLRLALMIFPSWLALAGVSHAQCIAVGNDTGCGTIITITNNGTTIKQTGQGPYDGSDDTMVGVVNLSNQPIFAIGLKSGLDIFGFDGDGVDTYGAPGNSKDTGALGGYGGPNAYFSNINGAQTSGTVNFVTPLAANGGTTYFSLENALTASTAIQDIVNGSISVSLGGRFNGTAFGLLNGFKPTNITGTFTPNGGLTLAQAEAQTGFSNFQWMQTITRLPAPSPYMQNGNPNPLTAPPSFVDAPLNGYTYCNLPGYQACLTSYPFYPFQQNSGTSLGIFDAPGDTCIPNSDGTPSAAFIAHPTWCSSKLAPIGSVIAFSTRLIGVLPGFVANTDCLNLPVPTCVDLGVGYDWTSNYNGTNGNGGAGTPGQGGIAVTASYLPLDPATADGLGGITLTNIYNTTTYSPFFVTTVNGTAISSALPSLSAIDLAQPFYLASTLDTAVSPDFRGGVLRMDTAGTTNSDNFTVDNSSTNTIDAFGNAATFAGNFLNAVTGTPGNLHLTDSVGGGKLGIAGGWGSASDPLGQITNDAAVEVSSAGAIYATGIVNNFDGVIVIDAGGRVNDALGNAGVVTNAGVYTADVDNAGAAAYITNASGAVWNGNLLSNTGGAAVLNEGTWTGSASNAANLGNASGATWTGNGINLAGGLMLNNGAWNGTLSNQGVLDNQAGGTVSGLLTNGGGLTTNEGTLNGGAWIGGGTLTSTGTINGGLTVAAGATVNAAGQVNGAIDNTGAFNVTGALVNNGWGFTNRAGGALAVGGNSFSGLGAVTNAAGAAISIGSPTAAGNLGAASLANDGLLAMQNGRTGDSVVLSGAYAGGAGSMVSVDVNMASNGNQADRIVAAGTSGTSTISIQNVGSKKVYFSTPIVLVSSASGTGTFVAASDATTTAALAPNGVIDYHLENIAGSQSWGIVASVDTAKVSSVAAGTTSLLASVNSEFLPDVHDLIGEDPSHDRWSGQVWGRAGHSADTVDTRTLSSDPNSPSANPQLELQFNGIQFGGGGRVALQNSTLHFGVTAGYVDGSANNSLVTHTNAKLPFYGLYGVAVFPGVLVDLQAYHDELTLRPDATITDSDLKGKADNVSLSLALPHMVAGYRVEPFGRYTYTNIRLNGLTLSQGAGVLKFSDLNGYSAAIGVRINPPSAAGQRVAPPFLLVSVEQEAGRKAKTTFIPDSGSGAANIDFTTRRTGTFVHLGTGMTAQLGDGSTQAYVRADMRMGSTLSGYSLDVGIRKRF